MTVHRVKGSLRIFLIDFRKYVRAGDFARASKLILNLTHNDSGLRVLDWLVANFCVPRPDGRWPEIDGNIQEELEGFGDIIIDYQDLIRHMTLKALEIAAANTQC
jgi:hypothetical protein